MEVFEHHIYEYRRNLRNLILHTTARGEKKLIEEKLEKMEIPYVIHPVSAEKINVFFGNPVCVEVIKRFNKPKLSDLTDEEDFMLGIMLGYGMLHQCERYLKKRDRHEDIEEIIG